MQGLFADKPWVQPLAIAGSHVEEIVDENANATSRTLEEKVDNVKCKIKYMLYTHIK